MKYTYLFPIILVVGWTNLFANDSLKADTTNQIALLYHEKDIQFPLENRDTSLTYFHYPYNLLESFNSFLGNAGLANNPLLYSYRNNLGYNTGISSFSSYLLREKDVGFYHTTKPFTKAFYLIGPKEEQKVNLIHTQNIKKNWNAALDMTKSGGEGFYSRQKTSLTNFYLSTDYLQLKRRYGIRAYLLFNKVEAQENGGLVDDSLLGSEGEFALPASFDTYLSAADNSINSFSAYFKHYVHFGKSDTASVNDSTKISVIMPKWRLYHSINYGRERFLFNDNSPDSAYYSTLFQLNDSIAVYDSIHTNTLTNRIGITLIDGERIGFDFWGEYEITKHQQNNIEDSLDVGFTKEKIDTLLPQAVVGSFISYRLSKLSSIELHGAVNVFGYGNGIYKGTLRYKGHFYDSTFFTCLSLQHSSNVPEFISTRYANNYFTWDYSFNNIINSSINGEIRSEKYGFTIGGEINNTTNLVYYDAFARPKQFPGNISILHGWAKKQFSLGNWHLHLTAHWQESSENIIRLAKWSGIASLFYENFLFKKATKARIGIDAYYFSEYLANAYMPATRQFYLQNETVIGNYPFLDAYLAFQVKRARLFFKVSHFNADLMGSNYFLVPHYPIHPLLFRLGVDWAFIN